MSRSRLPCQPWSHGCRDLDGDQSRVSGDGRWDASGIRVARAVRGLARRGSRRAARTRNRGTRNRGNGGTRKRHRLPGTDLRAEPWNGGTRSVKPRKRRHRPHQRNRGGRHRAAATPCLAARLAKYPNRPHWPVAGRRCREPGTEDAPTGKRRPVTRSRPDAVCHSPDRRIHRRGKITH